MLRHLRFIPSFLFLLAVAPAAFSPVLAAAQTETIAAVVNQDAISMTDLMDRLRLIVASSGLPPSKELQEKLTQQVLGELIEEQLKIQEAKRLGIAVSDEEVQAGFAQLSKQNNLTPEQFRAAMQHDGVSPSTMERQIRATLAWTKIVQQEMRPKIDIRDNDIDEYLARAAREKGKTEYLVAEIFLPISQTTSAVDAQALALKLVNEIRKGAPFPKVAQQFSSGAGAQRGGDLGWLRSGQFDPALEQAVAAMQKDAISDPVKSTDGYHILYLRDTRIVSDETIPSREQVFSTLGLQRLQRMAAQRLLDLKSSAFIENRAGT